jgi:hypothetical protein
MRASTRNLMAVGFAALVAVAAAAAWPAPGKAGEAKAAAAPARPIVAELFASPAEFVGKRIEIYGLVITLGPKLHTFHLQDVSQRPLTVDGARLPRIAVGDQVEIEGVLQGSGKDLVLVGLAMKRVKVTGGGGCC